MGTSPGRFYLSGDVAGMPVKAAVSADGLTLGRNHDCGLSLRDEEVSRLHCVVRAEGGRVTVENRGQNGTLVNGKKIAAVTEIRPGDVLTLGKTTLTLREAEPPVSPSAQNTVMMPTVARSAEDAPAPAAPPAEAKSLEPGDMVDRYRIRRRIGKGGMGTVYEAVHTGLDLARALKVLTLPEGPSYAAFRDKFLDEGKMLARLRHENITQVHDAAYDEKTRSLFFAMDLVLYDDGRPCTLADVAYDECDVSAWFAALASALDYIHAQGIVHSDIKLENVLVSPGQKIKLADFGVAHLLSGEMRSTLRGGAEADSDKMIGFTAHYVSPEILKANALPSVASDVYALGVLLVRLLSGKWYDEHPEALAEIASKRSLNWRPVLVQMLAADPKARPRELVKLVQQLRHGSKAGVRRKYQLENQRRRNQKIRLQRVPHRTTQMLRSTEFTPASRTGRIVSWCAGLAAVAAIVGGYLWVSGVNADKARAEEKRLEILEEAKATAGGALRSARTWFDGAKGQFVGESTPHLREYESFVSGLSEANVSASTDRALAELRNETLVRYADVLKAVAVVRAAGKEFQRVCDCFDETYQPCTLADAVKRALGDFEPKRKAAAEAFTAAWEAERRQWNAYVAAKARIAEEETARTRFRNDRNQVLADVRPLIESDAALKTAPELVQARAKVEEGDRLATAATPDHAAALGCYAAAVACLSNGCVRLKAERDERDAIEKWFVKCDENLRNVLAPNFRRGQTSLPVAARHAKDVSDKFFAKWDTECKSPSNRVQMAEYAYCLHAQAAYFEYLAKVLPGHREGLTFTPSMNGMTVHNGKYPYSVGWNEIFSSKRMDMKAKVRFRRILLDLCDVPKDKKPSARLLLGRWIVLKQLMPGFNTDEQADRLVEAVRKDGSAEAMACARRELPEEKFLPKVVKVEVTEPKEEPAAEGDGKSEETDDSTAEKNDDTKAEETDESADEKKEDAKTGETDESADESADDDEDGDEKAEAEDDEPEKKEPEPEPDPADFVKNLPGFKPDVDQERVIFFPPLQGLNVSAIGSYGVEIVRALRIKDSRRVRFELRDGVAFPSGGGARQPVADIDEGTSFDAGSADGGSATSRYALLAWIDDAFGDGRPLVLIRCQRLQGEN